MACLNSQSIISDRVTLEPKSQPNCYMLQSNKGYRVPIKEPGIHVTSREKHFKFYRKT